VKPYAVFTVVRNENLFLRLWCNYYCRLSPSVDVFVLDDSSYDGSVDNAKSRFPKIVVRPVPSGGDYDLVRLREAVQSFQRELLKKYEVVVYTDVDEFLLTADHEGLFTFLERFRASGQPTVRARGWHCVHKLGGEPPLSLVDGESVLKDRKTMWTVPKYDKVLISKVPSRWSNGFHWCAGSPCEPDPNLALFHAWMIDRDAFMRKQRSYVPEGRRFFESHSLGEALAGRRADIPGEWKDLIRW
jgi:hypothetical protein